MECRKYEKRAQMSVLDDNERRGTYRESCLQKINDAIPWRSFDLPDPEAATKRCE